MFELDEKLETELDLDGQIYTVNMAFDNVMQVFKILENPVYSDIQKISQVLYKLLDTQLDLDFESQVRVFHHLIEEFINSGKKMSVPLDLEGNPMPIKAQEKTQDLKQDASYIYNSFRQAYGINLLEVQGKLDWREFMSLLRGLPEDTEYKRIIEIRTKPFYKGKGTGEANRKLKEAKEFYGLK